MQACKKITILKQENSVVKPNLFAVVMRAYNGAEVCELAGKFDKKYIKTTDMPDLKILTVI